MHPPRLSAGSGGQPPQAFPRATRFAWPQRPGSRSERLEFAAVPCSVRQARHWTATWLAACDPPYSDETIDAVVLLVSELVTNAVQAVEAAQAAQEHLEQTLVSAAPGDQPRGGPNSLWPGARPGPRPRMLGGPARISLNLTAASDLVRIEVHDFACAPVPPAPDREGADEAGRGLAVVDALASRWGWQPSPFGKVVWCELRPDRRPR
jgi:histidine kinase-like protein